jgi:hypothetical protein
MIGGPGFHRGLFQTEAAHVDFKFADVSFGNRFIIGLFLVGPVNDLVVDVRKVADKGDFISTVSKIAIDHVEDDRRPRMADMAQVIHRDPANVHSNLILLERNELLFLA